nr:DUF2147 domain-containing protein [uncultured Carboxylicivirga sp.]
MKNLLFLLTVAIVTQLATAQNSNQIIGTWITQGGESKVTIEKNDDGTFNGKIIWLKDPTRSNGESKIDIKNPDRQLQNRPIIGLEILKGFIYNKDDKEWIDGTIYDPSSGNTYKCLMWFGNNKNILIVKGYIGVSVIGKKVEWKRV